MKPLCGAGCLLRIVDGNKGQASFALPLAHDTAACAFDQTTLGFGRGAFPQDND